MKMPSWSPSRSSPSSPSCPQPMSQSMPQPLSSQAPQPSPSLSSSPTSPSLPSSQSTPCPHPQASSSQCPQSSPSWPSWSSSPSWSPSRSSPSSQSSACPHPQSSPLSPLSPSCQSTPCPPHPQSQPQALASSHPTASISYYSNGELQLQPQPHEHQTHAQNDIQIPQYYDNLVDSQEFLPLCDLLFNVISLAAYYCNIVFDSIIAYTFYLQSNTFWFIVILSLILCSSVISQILSLCWYTIRSKPKTDSLFRFQDICVWMIHVLLLGVLWRYFKLFIPVHLLSVKHDVRDLCVLRMVHAFCEAAPMLIIQVYFILLKPSFNYIGDLQIISIFLSLFCVCWALASFSKNVRQKNIHKFVLTWLGVIFQFFWRLGTISSRVIALTLYATIYGYWVIVVIILHWFSMLLWLLLPKNLFYGEKMSFVKKVCYSCLIAWVYIFCYINMREDNSRNNMIAFYSIMFLENTLLLSICIVLNTGINPWFQSISVLLVWGGFAIGMLFMFVYYKFFHIRHLKHSLLAAHYDPTEFSSSYCPEHGNQQYNGAIHSNSALNGRQSNASSDRKLPISGMNCAHNGVITGISGVFNCRLNPALKRKKKKPSSFIPPPHPTALNTIASTQSTNNLESILSNKSVAKKIFKRII